MMSFLQPIIVEAGERVIVIASSSATTVGQLFIEQPTEEWTESEETACCDSEACFDD